MSDLKPCPFCGSTDLYVVQAKIEEYHSVKPEISCKKCRYTIKLKELAIAIDESPETNADWWDKGTAKKWNTRPAEDAKDKEIERMEAVIAEIGAMTLTGVDDVEDFIFMLCKDTVSDEAIKQAYRKYLENDIAKMVFGTDTNVPANAPDTNVGTMEG